MALARPFRRDRRGVRCCAALLLWGLTGLAVAATPPAKPSDPLEALNRKTYRFNTAIDRHLLRPLAVGYHEHVPAPLRQALGNLINNLEYPMVIVNDALQAKPKATAQDVARFLLNSTVGVAGLLDPASAAGLPSHYEDFGQTLGYWGVPPGPYLVLPILGSSDFRDAPGWFVDPKTTLEHYAPTLLERYGAASFSVFNLRVDALPADAAIDEAYDPYALVRDAYLARRNYLVHDGNVPSDDSSYDDPGDDGDATDPP